MAIEIQFFNLIIPIKNFKKCKEFNNLKRILSRYNPDAIGKIILYDKYFFRDGAMGMEEIEDEIKFWKKQGLKLTKIKNNKKYWNDLCVVDSIDGPTLPCDWLVFVKPKSKQRPYVYLKGRPKGNVVKINI